MRIGLIARADNTGLGVQTYEFAQHMRPARVLVVDISHMKRNTLFPNRYPGADIVRGFPTERQFARFLDDVDVVFTAETPYGPWLYPMAEQRGIPTVQQYNYEFLDLSTGSPTVLAAPTLWRFEDVEHPNHQHLPVPIATERFPRLGHMPTATRFLHVAGRPAVHDRNGTADLLDALRMVRSPIEVTITCQDRQYVGGLLSSRAMPANVHLTVKTIDVQNYWDLYTGHDVLIMPRRFGGLCLPVNEALGAGMPVIMPDVSPNHTMVPSEWLVPATSGGEFKVRQMVDLHTVDHHALADKIDQFASDHAFFQQSAATALALADVYSWRALKPRYEQLLNALVPAPA
ncbi:glycosyltransferase domain-containing protein [Nocardia nova SH22a]|uniref:Glycosyltransferase domain-containing protein n=1 Tax=Nocardia nova SH22a TaxID=1415166 RepID=W5TPH2_9NOCA|nr:glycosyltransferase family 1 protein [Nocardia nova]AHH20838.1 glycosyltransferase domain-containing protein [Nocardia nova SH22a]